MAAECLMNKEMETFINESKYSKLIDEPPDKNEFPDYYKASKHEFTIRAGEMLFIPAGWYHWVFSDIQDENEINYAVNYWFLPINDWDCGKGSTTLPHVTKSCIPYIDPNVVFKNSKWRATHSSLRNKSGRVIIPSDRLFHKFGRHCRNDYVTISDFLKSRNEEYYYIQNSHYTLDDTIANYMPQYPKPIHMVSTWINFGNCCSIMHYDEHDNFLCQLQGTKRVILFPHEDRSLLYMFNPTPTNILQNVRDLFAKLDQYVFHAPFNTEKINQTTYTKAWQQVMDMYLQHVSRNGCYEFVIEQEKWPQRCTMFNTRGHPYFERQRLPVTVIFIKQGTGSIRFPSKRIFKKITAGEVLAFPANFTYFYQIEGNLKLCLPI
jgi:hypothetical protein